MTDVPRQGFVFTHTRDKPSTDRLFPVNNLDICGQIDRSDIYIPDLYHPAHVLGWEP